jgi:hypothetical protein
VSFKGFCGTVPVSEKKELGMAIIRDDFKKELLRELETLLLTIPNSEVVNSKVNALSEKEWDNIISYSVKFNKTSTEIANDVFQMVLNSL